MSITFPDYCVAHQIFEPVFAAELQGIRIEELLVARAIVRLNIRRGRAVTSREICEELQIDEQLIADRVRALQKKGVVSREAFTGKKKENGLVAQQEVCRRFVPSPKLVLKNHSALGRKVSYFDPFSGEVKWIEA